VTIFESHKVVQKPRDGFQLLNSVTKVTWLFSSVEWYFEVRLEEWFKTKWRRYGIFKILKLYTKKKY